jgi:hypothetical protein
VWVAELALEPGEERFGDGAVAHPETAATTLLPEDAPPDAQAQLELVIDAFARSTLENEPQQRTVLCLSLEADPVERGSYRYAKGVASGGSNKRSHRFAPRCRTQTPTDWPSRSGAQPGSRHLCGLPTRCLHPRWSGTTRAHDAEAVNDRVMPRGAIAEVTSGVSRSVAVANAAPQLAV